MKRVLKMIKESLREEYQVDTVITLMCNKINNIFCLNELHNDIVLPKAEDYMSWLGDPFTEEDTKNGDPELFDKYVKIILGEPAYNLYDHLARLDAKLCYALGVTTTPVAGGVSLD